MVCRISRRMFASNASALTAEEIGARASRASAQLQTLTATQRTQLLRKMSADLMSPAAKTKILEANTADLTRAVDTKLDKHLLNRLKLTEAKLSTLAKGTADLADMPDPVGCVIQKREITKGLVLQQETSPLGAILIIFESRPDALPQIVSLALRSGNALILKGGKEAVTSNQALIEVINSSLIPAGLPADAFQLVTTREEIASLLGLHKYINLVIPRGGNELVQKIQAESKIPVLGHADGICHVYVDKAADMAKAKEVVVDSKCDYPAACNAMETLLMHKALLSDGRGKELISALQSSGVTVYGGPTASSALGLPPSPFGLSHEYSTLECLAEFVDNTESAVEWIRQNGSSHTESIITEDKSEAETFLRRVDSACVFHNSSTRFADGFRFGLGAEVGISTGRIHARGPVGVQGLLTTRWLMRSEAAHTVGQVTAGKWQYTHKDLPLTN